MVVKVFTGPGALARLNKKPVLSNKSLSRRVRALSGQEGTRVMENEIIYGDTVLVGGTSAINYLNTLNALENDTLHRIRFYLDYVTTATNVLRIIFFEDRQATSAEAITNDILALELYNSGYANDVQPFSAKNNNKNLDGKPRFRIIKDMFISSVTGTHTSEIARMFDVPMHNRKSSALVDFGFYVLAKATGATISIKANYDYTDLEL